MRKFHTCSDLSPRCYGKVDCSPLILFTRCQCRILPFHDTMSANETPPQFGRRLIPHLIDERAQCDWRQPLTSIPRSSKPRDGFKDISYRQFANAVNHCAWWMREALPKAHGPSTIAYTGPSDIRYGILTIAAIKTGFKV